MSATLRIYRWLPRTRAEGPGARACVWVQGCSLGCRGCFNRHLWSRDGGIETPVERLAAEIAGTDGIEGVTLLGGEPFEQAAGLASLARRVRDAGLSVMTFSGYRIEELRRMGPAAAALLERTDLLVDGRYVASRPDRARPWVGSTNQRFHFLSDRYRHLEAELAGIPDRLEIRIGPQGAVFVNGMAGERALADLREAIVGRTGAAA